MIKSTVWLTIALAFRSLGQAGLLIVFARFGSTETLGNYSLALAITAPIFVFSEFGLRTVYLTHKGDQTFRSYLHVRLATLGLAIIVTAAVGAIVSSQIIILLLLVSFLRAADSMGDLYSAPLQRLGRLGTILIGFSANAALTIGIGAGILAAFRNLDTVVAALALVSCATTVFLMKYPTDKLLAQEEGAGASPRVWTEDHRSVIKAGLPTGISWGLLSLLSSIPQYFLAAYFSQIEVGYFAVLLYVVVVVEIFLNAVSQTWIPAAKDLYRTAPYFVLAVAKTAAIWTAAFIPVSAGTCILAHFLLPLVFGSTYQLGWSEGIPLFCALLVLPMVFFSAMALNVANSYFKALTTSVAAVVIAAGAAIILIPENGISGALWVSVLALASRAVFAFVALSISRTGHRGRVKMD